MGYEEYNQFCASFAHAEYVQQWGGAHVWKVAGKVFAIGGWDDDKEPAYTFKTSQLNFDILKDEPGYRPAPYLASRGMTWIQQCRVSDDSADALKEHIRSSYHIVSLGLTKKKRKELGID